jgi:photosystem II stability/assembly factor-like uncharacterized protein
MIRRTLCVLLLSCLAGHAHAQWNVVAPRLTLAPNQPGVIYFKDGVLWAGTYDLFKSTDTGKTWTKTPLRLKEGNALCDISFWSRDTGIVCTYNGLEMFITHDCGSTWAACKNVGLHVGFLGPHHLVANNWNTVAASTDGGQTWKVDSIPFANALGVSSHGDAFLLAGTGGNSIKTLHLRHSTDSGRTWSTSAGAVDGDTWSLGIDSCDPSRMYAINENCLLSGDGFSKIYMTSDLGATWNTLFVMKRPYLQGAFAETHDALFVPSFKNGILRSVNSGYSWESIGGPVISFDSKGPCAITNDLLFAIDTQGSIWMTKNCGGDPVVKPNGIYLSQTRVDLAQTGCDTATNTFVIAGTTCSPATLDSFWLEGPTSFVLRSNPAAPRLLGSGDTFTFSYAKSIPSKDTAHFFLRFHSPTAATTDTEITIVGMSVIGGKPWTTHETRLTSYPDSTIIFPLAIEPPVGFNLDSLWPSITEITFGVSVDSSLTFVSYNTPKGWTTQWYTNILSAHVAFNIRKISATASDPIDLGFVRMRVVAKEPVLSRLTPDSLRVQVGNLALSPCIMAPEDHEWSVQVVEKSGVESSGNREISIFPNPAMNDVAIENPTGYFCNVKVVNALGMEMASIELAPTSRSQLNLSKIPSGTYEFILSTPQRTISRRVVVLH